jgi:hypothetical protein
MIVKAPKHINYFPRAKKPHAILDHAHKGKKRPNAGVAYEGKMKKMGSVFYPRKKII